MTVKKALHSSAIKRIGVIRADIQFEDDKSYSYQHYFIVNEIRVNTGLPISGFGTEGDAVSASKLTHEEAVRIKESEAVINQIKEMFGE